MTIGVVVTLMCAVGLNASLFMLRKTQLAERGQLSQPSVVQTPRARLYGGVSNALIGAVYYLALVAAIWLVRPGWEAVALLAICSFAALTSLVLAYSLLCVTRMPCPNCWTSHAINWLLAIILWLRFAAHAKL